MDTIGKNASVSNEMMLIVLEEMAQEQKLNTQAVNDLVTAVNGMANKVDELKLAIEKATKENKTVNYDPALDMIQKDITAVRITLREKEQPREFRFLLFPEQDRKLFYKIVFGRWLLYLVIMLFLNDLCKWLMHFNDTQKEITLEQLKNDHIKRSWDYLYNNGNNKDRQIMNEAYNKSEKDTK